MKFIDFWRICNNALKARGQAEMAYAEVTPLWYAWKESRP